MVRGASRGADGLRSSVVHEQRQHGKGPLSTQNIAQHTSPSCGGNPLRKGCRPSPARASVCVCVRARACVVFVLCCVRRVCVFVLCVRCVCVWRVWKLLTPIHPHASGVQSTHTLEMRHTDPPMECPAGNGVMTMPRPFPGVAVGRCPMRCGAATSQPPFHRLWWEGGEFRKLRVKKFRRRPWAMQSRHK